MRRTRLLSASLSSLVAVSAALAALPSPARAQSPSPWGAASLGEAGVERAVDGLELTAWADVGAYAGSLGTRDVGGTGLDVGTDLFSLTPTFGVMARILRDLGAELVVPLAFGHSDPWGRQPLTSALQAGNPWLAGYFLHDFGAPEDEVRLRLRLGMGWALPVAHIDPTSDGAAVATLALAGGGFTRGLWSGLLFLEDHFGLGIPVAVEAWFGGVGYASAEVDLWWGFNQNDGGAFRSDPRDTGALQLALEGGVEPSAGFRVSVRLQGVGLLESPADGDDRFQLAVEPRVTWATGALFLSAGLLVNLDEPAGVLGDDEDAIPGIWAGRLTVGYRL